MDTAKRILISVILLLSSIYALKEYNKSGELIFSVSEDGKAYLTNTPTALSQPESVLVKLADKSIGTFDVDTLLKDKLDAADSSKFARVAHQHLISDVTGLQTTLDGKQSTISAGTTGQFYAWDKTMKAVDWTYVANKPTTFYTHPTGDGNLHVPATGTTNNKKVLTAGSTAGSLNWSFVDWADLLNKPSTFTPAAHTLVSHSDWSTYFDQALKTTSTPTFAKINISNGGLINDWVHLGATHNPSSPYAKRWYKAYELTGTGYADEDIELRVRGDVNYYYGSCIVRLKITRYSGEPANQLHVTITPVSGWPSNALVKVDGGIVWVASNLIWGNIYGRFVQSTYNPGRVLFNTTYTETEPAGVSIRGTFGVKTYNGDAQNVVFHDIDGANGNFTGQVNTNTALIGKTTATPGGGYKLEVEGNTLVNGTSETRDYSLFKNFTEHWEDVFLHKGIQLLNKAGTGWLNLVTRDVSGSEAAANLSNITRLNDMNVFESGFYRNDGNISIYGNRVNMSRRNVGGAATINITTNPQIIDLNDYPRVSRFDITTSMDDAPIVYFKNAIPGDEIFVKIVKSGQYSSEYSMGLGWNIDPHDGTWMRYATKRYFHLICEGTATASGITANTWWIAGVHGLYQP